MKISIIGIGKLKEQYWVKAVEEYSKRLRNYVKLDIIELADEKAPEKLSEAEENIIKKNEGERILKNIKDGFYVVALAIEGKRLSSTEFSSFMGDLMVKGNGHIVFVIGGSLGLSDEVLGRSDFKLSFSDMTFPHQMMRVILLEQIYRGFRIMKSEPYHK